MDQEQKDDFNSLKINITMDEKSGVLQTPQVNRFKHENNVFSMAFKQTNELTRLNSITSNEIESNVSLVDSLNNPTSFLSPSPTSLSSSGSSLNSSISAYSSDQAGPKSAPKKSLLFRTISQSDMENQKQEIIKSNQNSMLNESTIDNNNSNGKAVLQKHFNIPLFDKLVNKNDFSEINNNNNKPKMVENNSNETPKASFMPIQIITKPIQTSSPNEYSKFISAEENFQHLNDKSNNEMLRESLSKNDSILSSGSASSYDDMVSSSDQTEKKPKKRRSIELNTDARKEQIRNSNREAARRCRERKRNYIEFLEKKIRALENKNDDLTNENQDLKKTLSDHKNCNLSVNTGNFANSENNFGGALTTNQATNQLKGVPVYLTVLPSANLTDANDKNKKNQIQNSTIINIHDLASLNGSSVLDKQAIQKVLESLMGSKQHQLNQTEHQQSV